MSIIPENFKSILKTIETVSPQQRNSFIKKHLEFYNWLILNTPNWCRTLTERIYLINNPHVTPICENGNLRTFKHGEYQYFCTGHCKCSKQHKKELFKEKYGVDNPMQLEAIQEKVKKTNIDRYGVENPQQNKNVKSKTKITNLKKYGVESILELQSTHDLAKKSNIEKYNTEYVAQSEIGLRKIQETMVSRYGVINPGLMSDHNEKVRKTSNKKYGKSHIMKTKIGKGRHKSIVNNRYGVSNIKLIGKDPKLITEFNDDDIFKSIYNSLDNTFQVANYFGYTLTPIQNRAKELNLAVKSSLRSIGEQQLADELINIVGEDNVILNCRNIIAPYEIDILIGNVGIEYNGAYWHSMKFIDDKFYHLNKTKLAAHKGIKLIHIFDTEWNKSNELVLSLIKSKLGLIKNRIYARKCVVKQISPKEYRQFFNSNHLQGNVNSHVAYGLFNDNIMVAAMSFGKPRFDKSADWELLRFANLMDVVVVGAASKLLSYFRSRHPGSIISYANKRFSDGNLYNQLGFKYCGDSGPNYYYLIDGELRSRINYQKYKLRSTLDSFDESKTAIENMMLHGMAPIFDCGNQKWRLT